MNQPVVSSIKIYHNNTALSNQLYNKLSNYKLSFETAQESLSKRDFKFIIDNCIDIHPDTKNIMHSLFNKGKYEILDEKDYKQINHPIIIDYTNKLIAVDNKSFDRLMTNYNTCGMQNFTNDDCVAIPKSKMSEEYKSVNSNLIHPHVAEYADLF